MKKRPLLSLVVLTILAVLCWWLGSFATRGPAAGAGSRNPSGGSNEYSGAGGDEDDKEDIRKSARHLAGEIDSDRVAKLEKRIKDHDDYEVGQRKKIVHAIRNTGIIQKGDDTAPDPSFRDDSPAPPEAFTVEQLAGKKVLLESQINSMKGLEGSQLVDHAASLDLPYNGLKPIHAAYQKLEGEIAELKEQGAMEADPLLQEKRLGKARMEKLMQSAVPVLLKKLQADLDHTRDQLKLEELRK